MFRRWDRPAKTEYCSLWVPVIISSSYRFPSALVLMTSESLSLLKEFTMGDGVLRIFEWRWLTEVHSPTNASSCTAFLFEIRMDLCRTFIPTPKKFQGTLQLTQLAHQCLQDSSLTQCSSFLYLALPFTDNAGRCCLFLTALCGGKARGTTPLLPLMRGGELFYR